ncbi:trypsin-related protease [Metarhizium acridum CQMa 102]|uniref:Trypsin-related protease n=1 Tax=Metarhizium acridum (strain CQMa 102) TaxID=655827 RepID=E9EFR9_METAQ|nr:trypsin-related protease [Metarhizium acridum CQMa 102]EFY85257.1 trypsin-related protease [Metarhizium acridum CQMa 102]
MKALQASGLPRIFSFLARAFEVRTATELGALDVLTVISMPSYGRRRCETNDPVQYSSPRAESSFGDTELLPHDACASADLARWYKATDTRVSKGHMSHVMFNYPSVMQRGLATPGFSSTQAYPPRYASAKPRAKASLCWVSTWQDSEIEAQHGAKERSGRVVHSHATCHEMPPRLTRDPLGNEHRRSLQNKARHKSMAVNMASRLDPCIIYASFKLVYKIRICDMDHCRSELCRTLISHTIVFRILSIAHMVSNVFAVAVAAWVVQMATALPADSSINVVGGTGSDGSKTPFIVALQNNRRFFCGGSLADDQTVITAAHCIQDPRDVQRLTIRAGSLSPSSGGTVVPVASAIVHPEWDPDRFNNDIAILKLAKSVGGNQSLGFAPLPKQDSDPTEGTNLVVAGWGATREGSKNLPGQLREVAVPVQNMGSSQSKDDDF